MTDAPVEWEPLFPFLAVTDVTRRTGEMGFKFVTASIVALPPSGIDYWKVGMVIACPESSLRPVGQSGIWFVNKAEVNPWRPPEPDEDDDG